MSGLGYEYNLPPDSDAAIFMGVSEQQVFAYELHYWVDSKGIEALKPLSASRMIWKGFYKIPGRIAIIQSRMCQCSDSHSGQS